MKLRRAILGTSETVVLGVLLVCASTAQAQQNQSTTTSQNASGSSQQDQQPAPAASSPSGPVTGFFTGFLNNLEEGRSMVQFGLSGSESAIWNPTGASGSNSVFALTSVSGNVELSKIQQRSVFTLGATAGGLLYDTDSSLDSGMGSLNVGESVQFRRWSLNFGDQFYYLPQTPFGFTGGLLNGFGAGGFGGVSTPSPFGGFENSIVTTNNSQITDTAAAQANFLASARTTWTLSAGYSITDYIHGGTLASSGYNVGVGYNYQVSARDTIGAQFTAAFSDYGVTTNAIDSYSGTINYGHRFTSRFAAQVAAGALDYNYLPPTGGGRISNLTYTASGGLNYLLGRNSLQLAVVHQVYNGSGFLYGGIQTFAQASVSRQVSRFWQVSGGVGFGKATGLGSTPTAGTSYQTESGNVALSRQLNPQATIFVQGVVLHQNLGGTGCAAGVPCAPKFTQYVASVGLSWNFRPRPLD